MRLKSRRSSTPSNRPVGPLSFREAYDRAREHPAVVAAGEEAVRVLRGLGIQVTDPADPRPMHSRGQSCAAQAVYVDLVRKVSRMLREGTTEAALAEVGL